MYTVTLSAGAVFATGVLVGAIVGIVGLSAVAYAITKSKK